MYQQSPGTYIQLGVASFWWDCYTGYPSGFVRVNEYVDWIKSTSGTTALIAAQNSIVLTSLVIALRNLF